MLIRVKDVPGRFFSKVFFVMECIPLFSSNLFCSKIENKKILDEINNFSRKEKYRQTTGGAYTSDIGLDMRILEKIPSSKSYLMNICDNLFKNTLMYPCQFEITTSWFTRAKKNQESVLHNHRNCFYSAVLYFGEYEKETVGQIDFMSPIQSLFNYDITPTQWNLLNSHQWSFTPDHGLLMIFPSFLYHKITHHNSKNNRYSLAFNIIPVGDYGEDDSSFSSDWVY